MLTGIGRQFFVFQHFGYGTCDECERSAQFVRDVCKETELDVSELFFDVDAMAQTVDDEKDIYCYDGKQNGQDYIEQYGPIGFPEGRCYVNGKTFDVVAPYTVAVGRFYLEFIASIPSS